jgi:hypothetical protein
MPREPKPVTYFYSIEGDKDGETIKASGVLTSPRTIGDDEFNTLCALLKKEFGLPVDGLTFVALNRL